MILLEVTIVGTKSQSAYRCHCGLVIKSVV